MALTQSLAVELALERAIARAELDHGGAAHLWATVITAAKSATVATVAPTNARYLRALTFGRLQADTSSAPALEPQVDVPVRLFPRVLEIEPTEALTPDALEEALLLEVAAIGSGRLMIEWVLLHALAGQSARDAAGGNGLQRQCLT